MDFESLQKAVDTLVELWDQLTGTLNEAADTIAKAFGQLKEEQQKAKAGSSPKKYGMSLVKKNEQLPRYFYCPVVRRNLPYQRRRF